MYYIISCRKKHPQKSEIIKVVILFPILVVFHPKMLYWQKMTGAVFQIKVSAEFVLKQFSEVSGLDGYSGSLSL